MNAKREIWIAFVSSIVVLPPGFVHHTLMRALLGRKSIWVFFTLTSFRNGFLQLKVFDRLYSLGSWRLFLLLISHLAAFLLLDTDWQLAWIWSGRCVFFIHFMKLLWLIGACVWVKLRMVNLRFRLMRLAYSNRLYWFRFVGLRGIRSYFLYWRLHRTLLIRFRLIVVLALRFC